VPHRTAPYISAADKGDDSMTDDILTRRKGGVLAGLRRSFLTGLVVVLPIVLTIYMIWTVIGWIDGWVLPFVPSSYHPNSLLRHYFGPDWTYNVRGLGVIVFLVFTIIIGWLAKGFLGRSVIRWGEGVVGRMPVVRSIYKGAKQISQTMFSPAETKFDRACLVEFPRKGVWAVGFVAGRAKGEIKEKLSVNGEELWTIFIAPTPVPTAGFLIYVPESQVKMLDMSLEDAAKLIISAGLVYPDSIDDTQTALASLR
jgi:uncharacterized membrane protein